MLFIIRYNYSFHKEEYRILCSNGNLDLPRYLNKDGSIGFRINYKSKREAIQTIKKFYPKVRKIRDRPGEVVFKTK